ncbi:MAG: molecular chaperone DnaJ [Hyphomicrobiaceae bacterium]
MEHTSPEALLAVPLDQPERIFSGSPQDIRAQWRALALRHHPDCNPGTVNAQAAFRHLLALKKAAEARIKAGAWTRNGERLLTTRDGRCFRLRFISRRPFELGESYIGRSTLAFAIEGAAQRLVERGIEHFRSIGFADAAMQRQLAPLLPRLRATTEAEDCTVVVLHRAPGLVLLADLIAHGGGHLDPRHVAWVVSGLENLACYLGTRGLVHGAISPDTVLVDPVTHRVALLGGWWYATPFGARLMALPTRTIRVLPRGLLDNGRAREAIDLELIRLTARECLGDATGTRWHRGGVVPSPLKSWMLSPPLASASEDYAAWEEAREAAFGPRRFTETGVSAGDVYPNLEQ